MLLFVDNLTNVDFSYLHPERGLLGETWLAHIELSGALDAQGMVCDFGIVKKTVRNWLDTELDHRLAIPMHNPQLRCSNNAAHHDSLDVQWQLPMGCITTRSPSSAIACVTATTITPDSVAAWATTELRKHLPDTIDQITLRFTQESINGASYQYSHGLKKHAGNCQRIAHGHRSTIAIWRNGEPAPALEADWAKRWQDIYIGTREDLMDEPVINGHAHLTFAYRSQQGAFTLTLPKQQCYLIETDTTVEFIAQHIAEQLAAQEPGANFRVKAFEGIGKGAIASAG